MTACICPHCGYDLEPDNAAIEDGPYRYQPGVGVLVDGKLFDAPPQVHELLASVMRTGERPLARFILAERLGYEGDNACNLISVLLWRLRALLAPRPLPIENIRGRGLRWVKQV